MALEQSIILIYNTPPFSLQLQADCSTRSHDGALSSPQNQLSPFFQWQYHHNGAITLCPSPLNNSSQHASEEFYQFRSGEKDRGMHQKAPDSIDFRCDVSCRISQGRDHHGFSREACRAAWAAVGAAPLTRACLNNPQVRKSIGDGGDDNEFELLVRTIQEANDLSMHL